MMVAKSLFIFCDGMVAVRLLFFRLHLGQKY